MLDAAIGLWIAAIVAVIYGAFLVRVAGFGKETITVPAYRIGFTGVALVSLGLAAALQPVASSSINRETGETARAYPSITSEASHEIVDEPEQLVR